VRSTIPEEIAELLGIAVRTTVEWMVDGETRRVLVWCEPLHIDL